MSTILLGLTGNPETYLEIAILVVAATAAICVFASSYYYSLDSAFLASSALPLILIWGYLGMTLEVYSESAFYQYLAYTILYSATFISTRFWIFGLALRTVMLLLMANLLGEYDYMFTEFADIISYSLFGSYLLGIGKSIAFTIGEDEMPYPFPNPYS